MLVPWKGGCISRLSGTNLSFVGPNPWYSCAGLKGDCISKLSAKGEPSVLTQEFWSRWRASVWLRVAVSSAVKTRLSKECSCLESSITEDDFGAEYRRNNVFFSKNHVENNGWGRLFI